MSNIEVVLYGNGCPMCRVMGRLLERKGIDFTEEHNLDKIVELGFKHVPVLKVNDRFMDFSEGQKWISGR